MRCISFLLTFLFLALPAFAADCNINLNQNSDFQDVNKALNCLNGKISALEAKIAEMEKGGGPAQSQKAGIVLYSNKTFDVSSASLAYQNNSIFLSFVITNKTNEDLLLAILWDKPIVIDSLSRSYIPYNSGYKGIRNVGNNEVNKDKYDVLNPGVPTPVSLEFAHSKEFEGKIGTFKVVIAQLSGKKQVTYSFGATNVPISGKE